MITKIKQIIIERWKFYLIGYIIGYLLPIIMDRKINIYYLFPIKLMGIACALVIGTAFYFNSIKMPIFKSVYRGAKYIFLVIGLMIFVLIIEKIILYLTGFDINPYIS